VLLPNDGHTDVIVPTDDRTLIIDAVLVLDMLYSEFLVLANVLVAYGGNGGILLIVDGSRDTGLVGRIDGHGVSWTFHWSDLI